MTEKKKNEKKDSKYSSAREVAEAMVENMKANMADPNFLDERERRLSEAAKEVLKKRKNSKDYEKDT
jgi:hypothetical protein